MSASRAQSRDMVVPELGSRSDAAAAGEHQTPGERTHPNAGSATPAGSMHTSSTIPARSRGELASDSCLKSEQRTTFGIPYATTVPHPVAWTEEAAKGGQPDARRTQSPVEARAATVVAERAKTRRTSGMGRFVNVPEQPVRGSYPPATTWT